MYIGDSYDIDYSGLEFANAVLIFFFMGFLGGNHWAFATIAQGVPASKRRKAILIGIAATYVMRVASVGFNVHFQHAPFLRLAWGLLLLGLAFSLLLENHKRRVPRVALPPGRKPLWRPVGLMLLADAGIFLNFSGALNTGATFLTAISLGISLPLVFFIASVFSRYMERDPDFVVGGILPLGFFGGLMIANDRFLRPWLPHGDSFRILCGTIGMFLFLCLAVWLGRRPYRGPEVDAGPAAESRDGKTGDA